MEKEVYAYCTLVLCLEDGDSEHVHQEHEFDVILRQLGDREEGRLCCCSQKTLKLEGQSGVPSNSQSHTKVMNSQVWV